MEQYTANSNSSTEQIVVQAGQIQQQVWKYNCFKQHSFGAPLKWGIYLEVPDLTNNRSGDLCQNAF